jgi:hypothetical protein
MSPKWHNFVEKRLKPGETIEKNYWGKLDGINGYLFLTNQRILFSKQEGLFKKRYEIILDLPKDVIEKTKHIGKYQMEFIEKSGKRHTFNTDIDISIIEESVEEAFITA